MITVKVGTTIYPKRVGDVECEIAVDGTIHGEHGQIVEAIVERARCQHCGGAVELSAAEYEAAATALEQQAIAEAEVCS